MALKLRKAAEVAKCELFEDFLENFSLSKYVPTKVGKLTDRYYSVQNSIVVQFRSTDPEICTFAIIFQCDNETFINILKEIPPINA